MAEWSYTICGCFDNCMLCLITYIAPCYTLGKTAEAVGESCVTCGIAYLFAQPCVGAMIRGKVREQAGIEGSFIGDLVMHLFCPLCALVQDNQQACNGGGQQQSMARY